MSAPSSSSHLRLPPLLEPVQRLGQLAIRILQHCGQMMFFLLRLLFGLGGLPRYLPLFLRQMHHLGVRTLLIVLVSGAFVGMVLALQGYHTLVKFGAEESLGVVLALSLLRELGPVVSALLFVGRAGSALTAEIGLMRSTEQIASLQMMAIDPYRYVIAPRFAAGVLSLPLLGIIFSASGIWGGYLMAVVVLGIDGGSFWSQMQSQVSFVDDVLSGLLKSIIFAATVTWVVLFEGYASTATPRGVSEATTRAVVNASLLVLALDFMLTAWLFVPQ